MGSRVLPISTSTFMLLSLRGVPTDVSCRTQCYLGLSTFATNIGHMLTVFAHRFAALASCFACFI